MTWCLIVCLSGGALYTGIDPNVDISNDDSVMKLMRKPFLRTIRGSQFLKCRSKGCRWLSRVLTDVLTCSAPTFVASFPVDDFMYFVFREMAYSLEEDTVYSRVARVCMVMTVCSYLLNYHTHAVCLLGTATPTHPGSELSHLCTECNNDAPWHNTCSIACPILWTARSAWD